MMSEENSNFQTLSHFLSELFNSLVALLRFKVELCYVMNSSEVFVHLQKVTIKFSSNYFSALMHAQKYQVTCSGFKPR